MPPGAVERGTARRERRLGRSATRDRGLDMRSRNRRERSSWRWEMYSFILVNCSARASAGTPSKKFNQREMREL